MRKLIFAINTTLDGCVDHTKQFVDEEASLEYFTPLIREADLQVFGRKTYQLIVPYWPDVLKDSSATKADIEFARAFDSINKIVFSRSLERAEDRYEDCSHEPSRRNTPTETRARQKYFSRWCGYSFAAYTAWPD